MYRIELFLDNGTWMARSNDPMIVRLFGTDTLPTAFTTYTPVETVKARIERLNPSAQVVVL